MSLTALRAREIEPRLVVPSIIGKFQDGHRPRIKMRVAMDRIYRSNDRSWKGRSSTAAAAAERDVVIERAGNRLLSEWHWCRPCRRNELTVDAANAIQPRRSHPRRSTIWVTNFNTELASAAVSQEAVAVDPRQPLQMAVGE